MRGHKCWNMSVEKLSPKSKFIQGILNNNPYDYGICPPPIKAQDALNVLITHFLGENWYTVLPLNQEQVNTSAVYQILEEHTLEPKNISNYLKKFKAMWL